MENELYHVTDCTNGREWIVLSVSPAFAKEGVVNAETGSNFDDLHVEKTSATVIEVKSETRLDPYTYRSAEEE